MDVFVLCCQVCGRHVRKPATTCDEAEGAMVVAYEPNVALLAEPPPIYEHHRAYVVHKGACYDELASLLGVLETDDFEDLPKFAAEFLGIAGYSVEWLSEEEFVVREH